jgi:PEP-CTERM motif
MRRRITPFLCLAATWVVAGTAFAQDIGATGNGNWGDPSTWTTGTVPGTPNNVYIGSTYPAGAAATATVTLTAVASANSVYLGSSGSGTSGTLNLGNNYLEISSGLFIGSNGVYFGGTGVLQEGPSGWFTALSAYIYSGNALSFGASDAVGVLSLYGGSTATTAATGNVSSSVGVNEGSVLHLGADLSLGSLVIRDAGSMVDAHHFGISVAGQLLLDGTSPGGLINAGAMQVDSLLMANGSTLTLHGGDLINTSISLTGDSVLTVQQANGMGLTFNGTSTGSLSIDPSHLDLVFTSTGWDFRWPDPAGGGNWISTIDGLIGSGAIVLDLPAGYSYEVVDQGGYTSINGVAGAAVPEPSSLVLAAMAAAGIVVWRRWPRSRSRR